MIDQDLVDRGLVLLGCGKMGSAMLKGWLDGGLPPASVHVLEPFPSDWLRQTGVALNGPLPAAPAVALIAVKPQMMGEALPRLQALPASTLYVSIAAGTSIAAFEKAFPGAPIVRAMPNTPAAVGQGITALIGNETTTDADLARAEALLSAVGQTVRLETEGQMDAVTGTSGSGPAYVFHMVEALATAAEAEGLPPALAMQLARATVEGAGALLAAEPETSPAVLRANVTSPKGTTFAGLTELMAPEDGLTPLMRRTVAAASNRSRELGE